MILERIRARLLAAAGGSVPAFTVSCGVAEHAAGEAFEDALGAVDRALFQAKRNGRDRVELAGEPEREIHLPEAVGTRVAPST